MQLITRNFPLDFKLEVFLLSSSFSKQKLKVTNLFRDGMYGDYTGDRDAQSIVSWVNKRVGPPSFKFLNVKT